MAVQAARELAEECSLVVGRDVWLCPDPFIVSDIIVRDSKDNIQFHYVYVEQLQIMRVRASSSVPMHGC